MPVQADDDIHLDANRSIARYILCGNLFCSVITTRNQSITSTDSSITGSDRRISALNLQIHQESISFVYGFQMIGIPLIQTLYIQVIMAEYIKQEMSDLDGSGEKRVFYRMKIYHNINAKEFVSKLTHPGSELNEGSVLHVLTTFADDLAYYIAQGYWRQHFTTKFRQIKEFERILIIENNIFPHTI